MIECLCTNRNGQPCCDASIEQSYCSASSRSAIMNATTRSGGSRPPGSSASGGMKTFGRHAHAASPAQPPATCHFHPSNWNSVVGRATSRCRTDCWIGLGHARFAPQTASSPADATPTRIATIARKTIARGDEQPANPRAQREPTATASSRSCTGPTPTDWRTRSTPKGCASRSEVLGVREARLPRTQAASN